MSHSINSQAFCIIISAHASSQRAESPDRHVARGSGAKTSLPCPSYIISCLSITHKPSRDGKMIVVPFLSGQFSFNLLTLCECCMFFMLIHTKLLALGIKQMRGFLFNVVNKVLKL